MLAQTEISKVNDWSQIGLASALCYLLLRYGPAIAKRQIEFVDGVATQVGQLLGLLGKKFDMPGLEARGHVFSATATNQALIEFTKAAGKAAAALPPEQRAEVQAHLAEVLRILRLAPGVGDEL